MSALIFTGWDAGAVRHVLHRMRPLDAEEVFALQPHDDPDRLFAMLIMVEPSMTFAQIAWRRLLPGQPIAFLTITPSTPRVAEASMIATPEMGAEDFRAWAAHLREVLPGICQRAGIRRLQCRSLSTHRAAHRFLQNCG